MKPFTIESTDINKKDIFLRQSIQAFYHADYSSGGMWCKQGSIENMIWTLKNDVNPFPERLPSARQLLSKIISEDLEEIRRSIGVQNLLVCVVPRAKKESTYRTDQLYFREIISRVVDDTSAFFSNGTKYIVRHTNTRTTHLDKNGEGGDGLLPYPGITKDTCSISENVRGKDILLIDDLYTLTVNIDEDAIQALLDNGAKSVVFYAVGKTVSKY